MSLVVLPWQKHLDELTDEFRSNSGTSELFRCLSEFESKLKFCWNQKYIESIPWTKDYLSRRLKLTKSKEKAEHLRRDGNKFFQKKNYQKALKLYTESILNAPYDENGEELSLGFANRSAALFHLGEFKICLKDIILALDHNYPQNLRYKLYQRMGHCSVHEKKYSEAEEAFCKALEYTKQASNLTKERKASVTEEIRKSAARLSEEKFADCSDSSVDPDAPSVSYGRNNVITQATNAVCLKHNEELGRHIIAVKDIKAGDTLIVERPFAAVLLPDHYEPYCHHCFKEVKAPIGCRQCVDVRYCSVDCQVKSWSRYHCYECGYLDLLHSVGISHLSLRIILTAGLDYLCNSRHAYECIETNGIPGLAADGSYDFGYRSVYHLMPHSDNMLTEDVFQYTMTAILLLKCLDHSGFFKIPSINLAELEELAHSDDLSPDKLYIGGLLLRHIQQLVCNAHAITSLQCDRDDSITSDVESVSQVRIATAIYPTASLMNHSCDPNTISSFSDDVLVVRATRCIPKGEQVYNCYGPHYKKMNASERLHILKSQYFFTCQCTACTTQKDETCKQALKCPKCAGPLRMLHPDMECGKCGHIETNAVAMLEKVILADTMYRGAMLKIEKNAMEDALCELTECLRLRESVMYQHNKDLAAVQDQLARCYASTGQYEKAAEFLKKSIATTRKLFGADSIELGNELHKLAQVLFNGRQVNDAKTVIDQALQIITMHYGQSHPITSELMEMKTCLMLL